jgi:hypothetical protein
MGQRIRQEGDGPSERARVRPRGRQHQSALLEDQEPSQAPPILRCVPAPSQCPCAMPDVSGGCYPGPPAPPGVQRGSEMWSTREKVHMVCVRQGTPLRTS